MGKFLLLATGAGFASVLLSISVTSGSLLGLPLAYLAPLPLFLIGLNLGYTAAGLAAVVGSITLTVVLSPVMGAVYFASTGLAPFLLCRQALLWREDASGQTTWHPVGRLLVWLAGLTAVFFIAALVYYAGADGGLSGTLEQHLLATAQELETQAAGGAGQMLATTAEAIRRSAADGARVLPGTLAISWMLSVMLNGLLAQAILSRSGRNFRPTPKYSGLSLPKVLSYPAAAMLVLSFAPGSLGFAAGTLAAIAIWPYFVLGLVVVHVISRRLSARFMVLAAFYLFLLGLGWPAALVAGLGLMDQWMGLRQQYGDPADDQERE